MPAKQVPNEKLAGANSLLFSDNGACLGGKAVLHRNSGKLWFLKLNRILSNVACTINREITQSI